MSRLTSLFSVFMFFIYFLMSFLPCNIDTDFEIGVADGGVAVNGETVNFEISAEGASVKYGFSEVKADVFNYFGIRYSSDAYVKGVISYSGKGGQLSEEFFLEPGENAEFYSFIDGYLEKTKMNKLYSLEFTALDKKEASFELHGVGLFNREILGKEIYIESAEHKLGVNLDWGGALSYLEDKNSSVEAVIVDGVTKVDSDASSRYGRIALSRHVNLINANDTGRLVQQSYYGTGDCEQYQGGYYGETKWNYNPVQGGNQYNESAKIVDVRINEDSIYIKCRPLDWAKSAADMPDCYMEAEYSLSKGLVNVSCRFVDFSGYPDTVTTQECPAFYCIEPLNRFVYYGGAAPWTNDGELTYENDLIFWPDAGYPNFNSTENWAAFTGEFADSFSIGVYTKTNLPFLAGVFERGGCSTKDPATEGPTSYIAAVDTFEFRSFNPTGYEFWLSTGTIEEIRANFGTVAE